MRALKRNNVMYENVRVEMARNDLTILDVANRIGMSRETLSRKLSGKSPLNIDEVFYLQVDRAVQIVSFCSSLSLASSFLALSGSCQVFPAVI